MNAWNSLNQKQKLLFGILIPVGLVLTVVGYAMNASALLSVGSVMLVVPIIIILVRYKNIKRSSAPEAQSGPSFGAVVPPVHVDKQPPVSTEPAERDAPQYRYETAQSLNNHSIVDFSSNDYNAQVWMFGLKQGDEIGIDYDYEKDRYYMDWEIPLPPRIVNIVRHKRIVRMYVHNIIEQGDKRSIQIFVVYNEG